MKAYLFTGLQTQFRHGRYAEGCASLILHGGERDECSKGFEQLLLSHEPEEECTPVKVEMVVGAPVHEQLLTEAGAEPINWERVAEQAQAAAESTPPDDLGTGLWADSNTLVSPDNLSPDLGSLQCDLPAEESAGLNWSADRQTVFIVNVLSPPAPLPDLVEEELDPEQLRAREEELERLERQAAFPEMAERELAVVVRSRNAVVAAWLWRRHAAGSPLAQNAIRVDAWCGARALKPD